MKRERIDILGVKIDNVTFEEAVKKVEGVIREGRRHYVVTPNPEFVVLAQKDEQFRKILNSANLAVADGIGLLAAVKYLEAKSRFKNKAARIVDLFFFGLKVGWWTITNQKQLDVLPEQVSGIDLVRKIAGLCSRRGFSISFLGGKKGVAGKAAECLRKTFPKLKVVDTWDGDEADEIRQGHLPRISTDVLLVAFGHPKQEKWIAKNLDNLDVKVAIGVGGAFDFLISKPRRAPLSFRRLGLEWVWRLSRQPKRWCRILTAFPYFPLLVFLKKIRSET